MFVTAASWKSAAQVVKAESGPLRLKVNPDSAEYRCSIDRIEGDPAPLKIEGCIKLFARPRLNAAEQLGLFAGAAAVLTPKIQFKAINQFDFLKQGGILTQSPLLQRSLKNFVVTWDLRRLIPSSSDKATFANLYPKAKQENAINIDSPAAKVCVLKSKVISGSTATKYVNSYVTVGDEATSSTCKRLAIASKVPKKSNMSNKPGTPCW